MGIVHNNRLNSINHTKHSDETLSSYKKKVLRNRRPTNLYNSFKRANEDYEYNNKIVGFTQSNFITCPECSGLIDIRPILDNVSELSQNTIIKCNKCGLDNIDLFVELKLANKLELLESAGFPTGKLFTQHKKVKDMIIRPKSIKREYITDTETGIKNRRTQLLARTVNTDINIQNNNSKSSSAFIEEYDNYFDNNEQLTYTPLKKLADKGGVNIKNFYDVNL